MAGWLSVALGGAIGSVARHAVNGVVLHFWPTLQFPVATTLINVVGSLIFGIFAGLLSSGSDGLPLHWREFIFVGLLGGFTTFSTFAFETVTLSRNGAVGYALLSVAVQVIGGMGGLSAGLILAERIARSTVR
ncbi:MAG: CrcB family protein [Cyanobacteria bacterium]|nr:CrcB family protein [Cyanobacteriota bacterium]